MIFVLSSIFLPLLMGLRTAGLFNKCHYISSSFALFTVPSSLLRRMQTLILLAPIGNSAPATVRSLADRKRCPLFSTVAHQRRCSFFLRRLLSPARSSLVYLLPQVLLSLSLSGFLSVFRLVVVHTLSLG